MSAVYKLSDSSIRRRAGIDPKLIQIDDLAIQLTLIDYGHPADAGRRTAKRQNRLFVLGASKCDGYKKISNHQPAEDGYGKALDFYAYVGGATSWKEEHLAIVALAYFQASSILTAKYGKGYAIRWGGMWKRKNPKYINGIPYGWDMPHIELIN